MIKIEVERNKIEYNSSKSELSKEEVDRIVQNVIEGRNLVLKNIQGKKMILLSDNNIIAIDNFIKFSKLKTASGFKNRFIEEIVKFNIAQKTKIKITTILIGGAIAVFKLGTITKEEEPLEEIQIVREYGVNEPNWEEVIAYEKLQYTIEKRRQEEKINTDIAKKGLEFELEEVFFLTSPVKIAKESTPLEIAISAYKEYLVEHGTNPEEVVAPLIDLSEVEEKFFEYFQTLEITDEKLQNLIITTLRLETEWGKTKERFETNNFGGHRSLDENNNWYYRKYKTVEIGVIAHIECVIRLLEGRINEITTNPEDDLSNYNNYADIIVDWYCPNEKDHWLYLVNDISKSTERDYGISLTGEKNEKTNN